MPSSVTNPVSRGPVAVAGASGGRPPDDPRKVGPSHGSDDYVPPNRSDALKGIRMADPKGPIDPASKMGATRVLALRQSSAARTLLDRPGVTLREELAHAATALSRIVGNLDAGDRRALGARILGSEGMMPGGTTDDMRGALRRVAEDPDRHQATSNDRAMVIAMMGDIGALYADTGATTGVEGRNPEQAEHLRQSLAAQIGATPVFPQSAHHLQPLTERGVSATQQLGGSTTVSADQKSRERTRPNIPKAPHTGIHNTGAFTDAATGIRDPLNPTSSRRAYIASARVDGMAEPLVGHMSGSPAEILQVWDMLRGLPPDQQYVGVMQAQRAHPTTQPMSRLSPQAQESQHARAAGAAAFLVASDYHSAVEVLEGVLAYTGQDLRGAVGAREDAGHLAGEGAATSLITDLFTSYTQPRP